MEDSKKEYKLYVSEEDYDFLIKAKGLDTVIDVLSKISTIYGQNSYVGNKLLKDYCLLTAGGNYNA